mgnify:CR=1 FL=1
MNNLIISIILLAILAGASAFFVSELSQMGSVNNYSVYTYNIVVYKFINYSTQKTYFLIINYGYDEAYLDKIICLNESNSSEYILVSLSLTIYSQDNKIIEYNDTLRNFKCFIYGDKWFKSIITLS